MKRASLQRLGPGAAALLVEAVALAALAWFALHHSFAAADQEFVERAHALGRLMNRDLLRYESLADRGLLRDLLGPDFAEAIIVASNGRIHYSSDPKLVDQDALQVPWLNPTWGQEGAAGPRLFQPPKTPDRRVSVTPLTTLSEKAPYYRLFTLFDTEPEQANKRRDVRRVALGALACLVLSAPFTFLLFRRREEVPVQALEKHLDELIAPSPPTTGEHGSPGEDSAPAGVLRRLATLRETLRRSALEKDAALRALELKNQRIRAFVDALPDIVFILNAQGRYLEVLSSTKNPSYVGSDRIVGKTVRDIIPPPWADSFMEAIEKTLRTLQTCFLEYQIMTRRGPRWFEGRLSPIQDGKTPPDKVLWFALDISSRKREEELRHATMRAEAASRAKSEFLASMSHEIRTPMNVILGMGELLDQSSLTEQQKQYVRVCKTAGENLLELVDNVLDISKVEAGRLVLEKAPFDLVELIESVCDVMAPRAHQKKLEFCARIAPGTPQRLRGDRFRIKQILLNLLSNAIKFTQQGEVTLSLERETGAGAEFVLALRVADSGVGIPKDRLPTVFERFIQGDASSTRRYGGAGLGLSICKGLAELMGGALRVESQVGRGSAFTCSLRLERIPEEEPGQPDFSNLTALVVEDHQPTRTAICELLKSWSATALEAPNLDAARRALLQAQGFDGVDVVLLDGRLPELTGQDGVTAAFELKTLGEEKTAFIQLLDTETARNAPSDSAELFCAALRKPIKRAALAALLASFRGDAPWSEAPASDQPPAADVERAPLPPVSILIAEDSEFNAYVIKAYLKSLCQHPTLARNGVQALEQYKRRRYDLVLMDVLMPEMDGYAATAAIRAHEAANGLKRVPILALTANALTGDEEKSLAAGCDAHLSKPVRKGELLAAVRRFCSEPIHGGCETLESERITISMPPALREAAQLRLAGLRENADRILLALGLDDFDTAARYGEQLRTEGAALGLDAFSRLGDQLDEAGRTLDRQAVCNAVDELLALLGRIVIQ
jgi:PAS domain S-box-containing protein